MSEVKQDIGGPYFEKVPERFRLATEEDYHKGAFTNNKAFLIKQNDIEHYECHRVKYPIKPKILIFIRLERVFIYE